MNGYLNNPLRSIIRVSVSLLTGLAGIRQRTQSHTWNTIARKIASRGQRSVVRTVNVTPQLVNEMGCSCQPTKTTEEHAPHPSSSHLPIVNNQWIAFHVVEAQQTYSTVRRPKYTSSFVTISSHCHRLKTQWAYINRRVRGRLSLKLVISNLEIAVG